MKVTMLVANPFTDRLWTDPRVDKEARALLNAGHEVVVLGTGKYGQDPPSEEVKNGLTIIRRQTVLHRLYKLVRPPADSARHGTRTRQAHYYKTPPRGHGTALTARFLQFMHDLNNLLFVLAIVPEAVRQKADVYEAHDLNALPAAYVAARLTGGRLIYNSHELWTECMRAIPYSRWHKALVSWVEKMLCRRSDLVITVSQSIAQILVERYDIPMPLLILNVHPYTEAVASRTARRRLLGNTSTRVAVYVGYLHMDRGLEQMIDAVQYLEEGIGLAIVGDGVMRHALEARVREIGAADRVRIVGWVPPEEVPTYLASADLGIAPTQATCLSYYATLDNKIFSYVTAGIPMAVSDHPEKRRLVEKYGIGAVFDEKDPQDIARVINELVSDPVEYEAMRTRAREVGRAELNWEVVSRRFVTAVEQLGEKQR